MFMLMTSTKIMFKLMISNEIFMLMTSNKIMFMLMTSNVGSFQHLHILIIVCVL